MRRKILNDVDRLKLLVHDLLDEIQDLKNKLSIAYAQLYPEPKKPRKKSSKKVKDDENFFKKNDDGTVNLGGFVFIPEAKKPKRKTRKAADGVRNIRRSKGSHSRRS